MFEKVGVVFRVLGLELFCCIVLGGVYFVGFFVKGFFLEYIFDIMWFN